MSEKIYKRGNLLFFSEGNVLGTSFKLSAWVLGVLFCLYNSIPHEKPLPDEYLSNLATEIFREEFNHPTDIEHFYVSQYCFSLEQPCLSPYELYMVSDGWVGTEFEREGDRWLVYLPDDFKENVARQKVNYQLERIYAAVFQESYSKYQSRISNLSSWSTN